MVPTMARKKQDAICLTRNPTRLFEITVIAVADLGGAARSVDTEDVAIRCHEVAPSTFSWRKYQHQVNLEMVRVSLSDAKKEKNGRLLSGSGRTGWRLTKRGLDWVSREASSPRVIAPLGKITRRSSGSIDTVKVAREIVRIESSEAWAAWTAGQRITADAAKAIFRIDSYAGDKLIEIKITRLISVFGTETEHRRFLEVASNSIRSDGADNA